VPARVGRRLWRVVLGATSFALAASTASQALAQIGEAAALPDRRGVVDLAVAGSDDDVAALVDALRELVGRLGLSLRAVRAAAPPWGQGVAPDSDERARVFVDERFPDRIEITASAVNGRVASAPVGRSVPRAESPTIVVEQVAHAVHATLESLLSSGAPGSPGSPGAIPPQPPAPLIEPPVVAVAPAVPPVASPPAQIAQVESPQTRPARRRGGFGMDATAFASARAIASTSPVMGGGGAVDVTAWRGPWSPSLWVGGSYNAAFGAEEQGVPLSTAVTSIRAVPSVELLELALLELEIGAGGGVDVFHAVPGEAEANTVPNPATTRFDPIVCGQLVARVRVLSSARILVGVDIDYDFRRHVYTTDYIASGNFIPVGTVLEPWPVRPSAMIGLCVPLVGGPACAGRE